jgi:hypothetical protein
MSSNSPGPRWTPSQLVADLGVEVVNYRAGCADGDLWLTSKVRLKMR